MAPTFVFDKKTNQLIMALGSPGGGAIINYVSKTLIGTLDWQLNLQVAMSMPNFGSLNDQLKARKEEIKLIELPSGLAGMMRTTDAAGNLIWFGAADPRREGIMVGE
ncbi:hypothetical protein ACTFIZ_000189 [Dictyostelium cf. discoideum]